MHNKFLSINDFLKSDEAFNDLALIVKHKVNKYIIDNEIDIDEESVNEGTKPTKDNYKLFYLNNDGMTILFAPYQLVPWSSGVITVDIPWTNLSDIIKDEYQNEVKKEEKKEKITREERKVDEFKNSKVVAFTFDDGPNNRTTNMLLDGLDKYNAKVTFFVLGSRISYNKDVLLKAYQSGNEIGSHSYSHRNLIKLNDDEIIKEINDTNNVIKDVIGVSPVLLRPPYGSINSHVKSLSTMHIICWNVDSLDWKLKDRIKIKDEIVKNAKDGAIILVHDIYEESVMGALLAMEELYKEGYSFVTVSELAKIKGYTLDYDTTYYNFYKEA